MCEELHTTYQLHQNRQSRNGYKCLDTTKNVVGLVEIDHSHHIHV